MFEPFCLLKPKSLSGHKVFTNYDHLDKYLTLHLEIDYRKLLD